MLVFCEQFDLAWKVGTNAAQPLGRGEAPGGRWSPAAARHIILLAGPSSHRRPHLTLNVGRIHSSSGGL
jgi:hypothetical protein